MVWVQKIGTGMDHKSFSFQTRVWVYKGVGGWHFITLPVEQSDIIKGLYGFARRGFGSIPVAVTLGSTKWKTSIFPDKKIGAYVMPLKSEVRNKENIENNEMVSVHISLLI